MGVIVISVGTPWCAGANVGCTWEHLGAPAICLPAKTTRLGALAISLGAHGITLVQSGKIFFVWNGAALPGYYSYYLSFNDY
jgi:hypothetical protein